MTLIWFVAFIHHRGQFVLIHGDARGADRIADEWAKEALVEIEKYPADWKKHGKAAGPIRNRQMLKKGRPDYVIAFPGGKGTADMVDIAKKAGVEVLVIED